MTLERRALVEEGMVSIAEAGAVAGLSARTIRRLIASGELVTTRIGRRRLVPRRALMDLLARGLEPRPETR